MFKLMHKKLNKKGFTLAELLVVVAIVAILVAIAVPIFTSSLTKAQVATNEANVRSTKAAATAMILENWNTEKYPTDRYHGARDGAADNCYGWFAFGHVDAKGDLVEVKVQIATYDPSNTFTNPTTKANSGIIWGHPSGSTDIGASVWGVPDKPSSSTAHKFVEESGSLNPGYLAIVYIPKAEIDGK